MDLRLFKTPFLESTRVCSRYRSFELVCSVGVGWKDVLETNSLPRESLDDDLRVTGNRHGRVTIEQAATDFGVHPMTLTKWMRRADIDDGAAPGNTTGESAELRGARRRNRLVEQENEVLRRAAGVSVAVELAGPREESTRSTDRGQGSRIMSCSTVTFDC